MDMDFLSSLFSILGPEPGPPALGGGSAGLDDTKDGGERGVPEGRPKGVRCVCVCVRLGGGTPSVVSRPRVDGAVESLPGRCWLTSCLIAESSMY